MIGFAQERTRAFKSCKEQAAVGAELRLLPRLRLRQPFYFYLHDRHFGPTFIKISSYCPFAVRETYCEPWTQ